MRPKLATLSALESIAGLARRLGLGALVDRLAPLASRPFERFELDVDGVHLAGAELAHLHYVRELKELGRERTFVRLLADAVPSGGSVLEGGAHLGFVTVHAARAAGPNGRVVAFEPNVAVHGVLSANLAANGVSDRVEIRSQALGDRPARARFHVSGDTSSLFEATPEAVPTEIEVVRADDVVARTDVVKLDVEGAELAALRGMERLAGGALALFLECNPELLEAAGDSRDELIAWVRLRGFDVEWIDEDQQVTRPLSEPWSEPYVNLVCRRVA